MATPVLDNEFMQYWSKLTTAEKESLLNVAKQYVGLKKEGGDDLRKQLIMEERVNYMKGVGKSFSWEEVKDMVINKTEKTFPLEKARTYSKKIIRTLAKKHL